MQEDGTWLNQLGGSEAIDEWENQVYKKDRLGRETHWKYNAQGQLLQEKTPDGLITTHTYDEQGHCIKTQD